MPALYRHHITDSSVPMTGQNISVIPRIHSSTYKHASSIVTHKINEAFVCGQNNIRIILTWECFKTSLTVKCNDLKRSLHLSAAIFLRNCSAARDHFVFLKFCDLFPITQEHKECLTCTFALMSNSGCKVATPNPCLPISL